MDKIVILYGRFQPFTTLDLAQLKKLVIETGEKAVLVYVRSHQGYANTPFRSSTVKRMLEEIQKTYPELVEQVISAETWTKVLETYGSEDAPIVSVESDHNSIKASVARLALSMDARDEFFRMVPECLRTEDIYQLLRNEQLKYSV